MNNELKTMRLKVQSLFTDKEVYTAEEYTEIIDKIFVAKWYKVVGTDENGEEVRERKEPVTLQMQNDIDCKGEVVSLFHDINVKYYQMNDASRTGQNKGHGKAINDNIVRIKSLLLAMIDNEQEETQLCRISDDLQMLFKDNAKGFIDAVRKKGLHGKQVLSLYRQYKKQGKAEDYKCIYNSIERLYNDLRNVPLNVGELSAFTKG